MNKIKVGAVSYLNTKPLLYGIKRSELINKIELIEAYPAKIAAMLLDNEIDVGLVPVAVIPKMKEHFIITDFCIGAENEVASVCLFSEVPIHKVEKILLDYQSNTSVNLAKILLKHYWKTNVVFEDAKEDFREHINGTTAGVVIGDRALQQRKISAHVYDLASAWRDFTNLPFVFAAWVANKKLDENFINEFNNANSLGLQHIDEIVAENNFTAYDLKKYYTKNISYTLTADKKEALQKFFIFLNE
ncbi:MAG: menaquinone biosynthesis protein [Bacteroidetes bacterium]|nr:menaquinone biosynthesis protein [Bacteroidota bacterium]MBS1650121.1 menaquinone biosynthesis protein [Bacteroidota bacterium]